MIRKFILKQLEKIYFKSWNSFPLSGIDDEDALDMFADSLEDKLQVKKPATEEDKAVENNNTKNGQVQLVWKRISNRFPCFFLWVMIKGPTVTLKK